MKSFLLIFIWCCCTLVVQAQIPKRWPHKAELLSYLRTPKDSIFIQNRHKLEAIKGRKCTDTSLVFKYRTKSLQTIVIEIKVGSFKPKGHTYHFYDTVYKTSKGKRVIDKIICRNTIDGEKAYGNDCEIPTKVIKSITIYWNKKKLLIPKSAYKNLFEVEHCAEFMPAEAYLSRTKKYLFIYLNGSIGAGAYAVKLVFDKKGYVTRIVSTNDCTDAFDFLDAVAKPCEKF